MTDCDVIVVGAGMVGASIAWHAAGRQRVVLLEGESAPGYHSTGRSAALYTAAYGPPGIRALTRASRGFFDAPPAGFTSHPLLTVRGTLFVGGEDLRDAIEELHRELAADGTQAELLDAAAVSARMPCLRPEWSAVGLWEPGSFDIDVDALLQGYVRGARARGAQFVPNARVARVERHADRWTVVTERGEAYAAPRIVNAAGAWADEFARLAGVAPVRLEPRRRSAFLFEPPAGMDVSRWPFVMAGDESWYVKPDAGLLLGSPANVDLSAPVDVLPEDLDIAIGVDRIESATTLRIDQPRSTWAGLRSFVADKEPVLGYEPSVPGFFWAAALGGYGIQTAPAVGRLCAAWLADGHPGAEFDSSLRARVAPERFRKTGDR